MSRNLARIVPAEAAISITPDDDTDVDPVGVVLTAYTTAGACAVHDMNGDTRNIYLALGAVFPLRVKRVLATGTTAAGITGLVV